MAKEIDDFCGLSTFDDADHDAIGFRNTLELFPRLRSAEERPAVGASRVARRQKKLPLATRLAVSLLRKAMGEEEPSMRLQMQQLRAQFL